MGITAGTLIKSAFEGLNVFQPSESVPGSDSSSALGWLNRMVASFAQEPFTIPSVVRFVAPLVANKGSSTNPYTIGVGGDLNVARPAHQRALTGAGLLLNASTPPVEIPRGVFTDDGWESTRIKDLTSTLFTNLYYRPTTSGGLGTIYLYPVPDNSVNSLVLYLQQPLTTFADLTTVYFFEDGVEEMLIFNLMRRLAKPWGAVVDQELIANATSSLALIKRANLPLSDVPNDLVFGAGRRGLYDIQSGDFIS